MSDQPVAKASEEEVGAPTEALVADESHGEGAEEKGREEEDGGREEEGGGGRGGTDGTREKAGATGAKKEKAGAEQVGTKGRHRETTVCAEGKEADAKQREGGAVA